MFIYESYFNILMIWLCILLAKLTHLIIMLTKSTKNKTQKTKTKSYTYTNIYKHKQTYKEKLSERSIYTFKLRLNPNWDWNSNPNRVPMKFKIGIFYVHFCIERGGGEGWGVESDKDVGKGDKKSWDGEKKRRLVREK